MLIAFGFLALIVGVGCAVCGTRLLHRRAAVFYSDLPRNFSRNREYIPIPKLGIGAPVALVASGLILILASGTALVLLSFG
jgi:hypothetical protein